MPWNAFVCKDKHKSFFSSVIRIYLPPLLTIIGTWTSTRKLRLEYNSFSISCTFASFVVFSETSKPPVCHCFASNPFIHHLVRRQYKIYKNTYNKNNKKSIGRFNQICSLKKKKFIYVFLDFLLLLPITRGREKQQVIKVAAAENKKSTEGLGTINA